MSRAKRYHPFVMLLAIWNLGKNAIYFFFFLFVLKGGSDAAWVKYGKLALLIIAGFSLLSILWSWSTRRYQLDDTSFRLYQGVFVKSKRVVPFAKIQNINRHTTLFHRIFKVTAIRFETGMKGEDAAVVFRVVSYAEADRLEELVAGLVKREDPLSTVDDDQETAAIEPRDAQDSKRTLHFSPTRKELVKASFTSLSFFILIPVLFSLYSKADDFFDLEEKTEGFLAALMSSWWAAAAVFVLLSAVSVVLGIAVTFVRYGGFELSSDAERIYIVKGMIERTAFSIAKERVQGVEVTQSLMKRLLGMAEVRLITAGGEGEDKWDVNSLYPFLPVQDACRLVSELLPSYEISSDMSPLPRASLEISLVRSGWIWFSLVALSIPWLPFMPDIPVFGAAWWWIASAGLLFWTIARKILNHFNTAYAIHGRFLQFRTGGLTSRLFIGKREKIIEVKVTRGVLQRRWGLASVHIVNRARPVLQHKLPNIPAAWGQTFYAWYAGRMEEIRIE
ncbi:PH domain-containing protein [Paenibacillus macerans]|uniref:PH domain-containing protein n=1 Tax=Paenibacillus macerans TaxID=44252 RepID=UPI00203B95DD|nr:PH domain-containing protein [Paenibacillus macerans]MCM3700200.1 PH domain-containing protein [Paenibacillus macerans]